MGNHVTVFIKLDDPQGKNKPQERYFQQSDIYVKYIKYHINQNKTFLVTSHKDNSKITHTQEKKIIIRVNTWSKNAKFYIYYI